MGLAPIGDSMASNRWSRAEVTGFPPISTWPTAELSLLDPDSAEKFKAKVSAVKLYLTGVPTAEIHARTGIPRWDLPRMVKRCLELASDGRILGFRALIPYVRVAPYTRKKKVQPKRPQQKAGHSGSLGALLARFPKISEELVALIKKDAKSRKVHEHKIRATTLHHIFLDYLREQGVTVTEWPFNTLYRGVRSIQTFMKEVLNANFGRGVHAREEKAAKAHLAVGNGVEPLLSFDEPFDAVEIDAYSINALFTVLFSTPEGTETDVLLESMWLIAAIERASTAVLAYSIVYSSEVSADDVVRVIRDAVGKKWEPKDLTIPGLQYPASAGLPSGMISECRGANWGCLLLDGALAHLAKSVRESARRALGFALNWGPVAHFERRPNVERLFKSISDDIFRRLPSTTGANPQTGRADNAEEKAVRYKIRAKDVEELVDVYFAQFNATPTAGLSYLSPLEFIRYFVENDEAHFLIRHLPRTVAASSPIPCFKECVVRGGMRTGRRPYVQIDQVRYTSYLLGETGALIGKKIVVEIDDEDMRQVRAYLPNGAEFGFLKASGRWSQTKHSRKTRKAINSLIHRRILVLSEFDDPVQTYLRYLSLPMKKAGGQPHVPPPSKAIEAVRVSRESELPLKISPTKSGTDSSVKSHSTTSEASTLMDAPALDLNLLVNRKR